MKTITKILFASLIISVATISTSCHKEKDQQIPPTLSFKTGAGYTSADAIVDTSATITVGVTASKSEDKDLLTRFVASQKYDGGSSTTLLNESFNQDTYEKDMTIHTRNVAGTETYTYTIVNRDGLTKTISLILTVN